MLLFKLKYKLFTAVRHLYPGRPPIIALDVPMGLPIA